MSRPVKNTGSSRPSTSGNKKGKHHDRQVSQYDKIFRENIEAALPGLIRHLLGIHPVHTEELPDDIQHTKERKPDVLKKVIDKSGKTFVLHIEFQVKDELEMVFRMAEYYIMLFRRYQLQVRQYVIYIGPGSPVMKEHFRSEQMHFKYYLIALSTVNYQLLLRSDKPEEKILAILADFGNKSPKYVIEDIVTQVIAASKGDFSEQRHIRQLRILAQLRNLGTENLRIMDSITSFFRIEKDFLYIRGEKEGMEKAKETVVKNLLRNTDFTINRIASLSNTTVAFVKKVKKALN